jgi:DNA-binding GntR family transcriptional regulator
MAQVIEIPLHDRVVARLRAMLIEGHIAPGAKLNERVLAEHLRVSRTPLREAIKLLATEGLVDLLPNRGAVAVKLTEADVLHTFEALAGLEAMSGELAAQRITLEECSEIRALHYEMKAAFTRRDLAGYYHLNAKIHAAINVAAKNPVLTGAYQRINARVQALRFRTNQNEAKWKRAMQEHEAMVDALDAHDAPGMRTLMVEHLNRKRDTVLELLRAGEIYPQAAKA